MLLRSSWVHGHPAKGCNSQPPLQQGVAPWLRSGMYGLFPPCPLLSYLNKDLHFPTSTAARVLTKIRLLSFGQWAINTSDTDNFCVNAFKGKGMPSTCPSPLSSLPECGHNSGGKVVISDDKKEVRWSRRQNNIPGALRCLILWSCHVNPGTLCSNFYASK